MTLEDTENNCVVAEPVEHVEHEQMSEARSTESARSSDSEPDMEVQVCTKIIEKIIRSRLAIQTEISKHFRLGDSRREQLEAVIEKNLERVEKKLQHLRQAIERRSSTISAIDMVSQYVDVEGDIASKLEKLTMSEKILERVAAKLSCDPSDVKHYVKKTIKNEKNLTNAVTSLQMDCTSKDNEIRALKAELEAQKRRVAELVSGNREERPDDGGDIPGRRANETGDASESHDSSSQLQSGWQMQAKRRALHHKNCDNSSRRTCADPGTSYDSSESSGGQSTSERERVPSSRKRRVKSQMGEYLKFVALPDVLPYSGIDKDYPFENFVEAFELKYPSQYWEDKERCALFRAKLLGKARAQYEALAKAKKRNFYTVVNAMREMCKEELRNKKVVALGELRRLQKAETQSVGDFCIELERLTRRAYPELDDGTLSVIRADHLYDQLSHWDESCHLQEALEEPGSDVYEKLKDAAMRVERRHLALKHRIRNAPTQERWAETKARRVFRKPIKDNPIVRTKENNNRSELEVSGERTSNGGAQGMKCFKCKKMGHKARDCKNTLSGDSNRSMSLSARVRGLRCNRVGAKRRNKLSPPMVGKRLTVDVIILGRKRTALLDTGSEVSILPCSVLKRAMDDGIDIDATVKEMELPKSLEITDASGRKMEFLTAVEVDVKDINGDWLNPICMLVSKSKEDLIILGTNAIPAMGYKVSKVKQERKRVTRQRGKAEGKPAAVVTERVYIAPGEAKCVNLKCENKWSEAILSTKDKRIADGLCKLDARGLARVAIVNATKDPMVLRKGQEVGEWEKAYWEEHRFMDAPNDVLCSQDKPMPKEKRLDTLLHYLTENRGGKELSPRMQQIIKDNNQIFAVEDSELTRTSLVTHEIDTGDTKPIRQKTRQVPIGARDEFKGILNNLLQRGIIERSTSDWASPVVLVRKKDGTIRLCIDYRQLNKCTKHDAYPLPGIDVILQSLQGKRYFSTLDLASGYWQIPLSETAKEKSAFTTSEGLFQFTVLPFGLTTSPAVFQRLMDTVLRDLKNKEVFVYIDDILIATATESRHYEVLLMVINALMEANLRLKPQKCVLFQESVAFLGHKINAEGVHVDPDKVVRIKEFPKPTCIAELRTFLGMCGYYRKFVLNFSKIAGPLFELTRTGIPWRWEQAEEESFGKLKEVLATTPVLAQPDIEGARLGTNPYVIYTDASSMGVGAVLCQRGADEFLHPIYFASKRLSKAERNYHVTDLEALALVYALKKFHFFIYGMNVIARTDHAPLTAIFRRANVSARILRWAMEVQQYRLTIEHVKGKSNPVADALSRGVPVNPLEIEDMVADEKVVCSVKAREGSSWLDQLRNDTNYGPIITSLEEGRLDEEVRLPALRKKFKVADFVIEDGQLKLLREDGTAVLVVPKEKRKVIFDEHHNGPLAGHHSAKKMLEKLRKLVFWDGMYRDIYRWVKGCTSCLLANPHKRMVPPLKPIVTGKPFEIVAADILEMGLSLSGMKYVLVVVDHFSKWVGAYAMPDKSAATVATTLFHRWICEGGRWPKQIHTDQGPEFLNSLLDELVVAAGIKHSVTKGYNSRENGVCERAIGTIQRMMKKKVVFPDKWDVMLPHIVYTYNVTPHEATGESPFFVLHGMDPTVPSCSIPNAEVSKYEVFVDDYRTELLRGLQLIRDEVRANNEKYREQMKEAYDKRKDVDALSLPVVGGRVFMKLPREKARGKHPKLTMDWDGPYRVLETDETSALITKIGGNEDAIKVQYDLLLKCPDEIPNEQVSVRTRRKRVKRAMRVSVITPIVSNFRKDLEFDVPDDTHILHAQFRCRGQDFPAYNGGPSFALADCCVSKTLTAGDLISSLPHPANALPVECVIEAARVFAIWTQPGSVALKAQRIMNLDDKIVDPRSLGFAYAVFMNKCAHVSNMARAIEPATIMRHGSLSRGWPEIPKRIFELGWLTARKVDLKEFSLSSMMDRIHNRILLVVPLVLRRTAWMTGGSRTRVFYYVDFSMIKTKMDHLFTNDLGAVVLVLPPEEPRKVTAWLAVMSAIHLWVSCGTHVYLVNGPRTVNVVSWEHVTIKMRSHVLSYVSSHPEHAQLIVDVMQQTIGIMETQAAWAAVGVLESANEWMPEEATRVFYSFLRKQLEPMLGLEELKLVPFRAHKQKERGKPAPLRGPGNRKHRKRAACRLKDKMRAATAAMQGL